jgi:putative YhbY family RNA-binding protein
MLTIMLTAAERKALKGKAHKLEPVVHIGAKGLTDEVVAEIERALTAHGLIKVRAAAMEREERDAALEQIVLRTAAQPVQQVGKVFVLYRKRPDDA